MSDTGWRDYQESLRPPPLQTPVLEDFKFKFKTRSWGHTAISQNSVPFKPF